MLKRLLLAIFPISFYEDTLYSKCPRPAIQFIKARMGNHALTGAEIGVAYGSNAISMLKTLNIRMLYLIDPYEPYIQEGEVQDWVVDAEIIAKAKLTNFAQQVTLLSDVSHEAASKIPSELDFVYVDGNHEYDSVRQDLEDYYPKVKQGGVVAGHDFSLRKYPSTVKAVMEFASENNLEVSGCLADWWFVK